MASWEVVTGNIVNNGAVVLNTNSALFPIVPLLLIAPKFLTGAITLGAVVQVVAAFSAVQAALIWFVDNFVRLAEWFASVTRVDELMEELGNSFWSERQPNGFSDRRADWISTEHLDRRIRVANVVFNYAKPQLSAEEIIERNGFGEATRALVAQARIPEEKFMLLACSPEMMEA